VSSPPVPWLSATKTRNHLLKDPILDWLDLYGEGKGYIRDDKLPGFDVRTDFMTFVMAKGQAFEAALYQVLGQRMEMVHLEREKGVSVEAHQERTLAVMRTGPEAIAQACVAHPPTRTFGFPDLLIRSDVLRRLWPDLVEEDTLGRSAPSLGLDGCHYRVVDIKYTTLKLLVGGEVGNEGSAVAYKGQLLIYNRALAGMQDHEPETAYLMGRGWAQTVDGEKLRASDALDRLGPVSMGLATKSGAVLWERVEEAVRWRRRLVEDGAGWHATPEPSVHELRPNMGHTEDTPWHTAKKKIAQEMGELTLLWNVGVDKRNTAIESGILRIEDVTSASDVGVKGPSYGPVLDAILNVNRDDTGPVVQPERIQAAQGEWEAEPSLEFYVDFETVSDLDDDFSRLPEKGGQPMIFMIGCGHQEGGEWWFRVFTVDALTEDAEASIIEDWLAHMEDVRLRMGGPEAPKVIHWSQAEVSSLESAYNSAVARHPARHWPKPLWFDFLKRVIKAEPVVVRGSLGFGVKAVAKAMHAHGLIETSWKDGPTDGLGAMVGAWSAAKEAAEAGVSFKTHPLTKEIEAYNEVDTKVMWEIVRWLRNHQARQHVGPSIALE
jgi:hypothetical protein